MMILFTHYRTKAKMPCFFEGAFSHCKAHKTDKTHPKKAGSEGLAFSYSSLNNCTQMTRMRQMTTDF